MGRSTNVPMQLGFISPVRGVLARVANKLPPNERVVIKERKRGSPAIRWTDDQIAEMRRLHEQEGLSVVEVAKHFGATYRYARQVCAYEIRDTVRSIRK